MVSLFDALPPETVNDYVTRARSATEANELRTMFTEINDAMHAEYLRLGMEPRIGKQPWGYCCFSAVQYKGPKAVRDVAKVSAHMAWLVDQRMKVKEVFEVLRKQELGAFLKSLDRKRLAHKKSGAKNG